MRLKEVMALAGDKVGALNRALAQILVRAKNKENFVYGLEAVSALSIILKN